MTRAVDPIAEQLQALANDTPTLKPEGIEVSQELYTVLSGDDLLALPRPLWRVKNVFPECGTVVVHGVSRSGKTFAVLDLVLATALEREWFGYKTSTCNILYICLESAWGLQGRLRAWTIHNGQPLPKNLRFIIDPFDLRDKRHVQAICQLAPKRGILVIDTLNRATPGADENSSKDMSQIIAAAGEIQAAIQGLVLLVAHSGKDTAKGIRGHSSLFAALDANIEVGRNGDTRFIKLDKVKEAEDGAKKLFRLKPIVIGQDEDGADITSCIVEPLDRATVSNAEDKPLSGALQRALESLDKAIGNEGGISVHVDAWRPHFYAGHEADSTEAKQKAFQRARKELIDRGKISVFNDRYSRTDRT